MTELIRPALYGAEHPMLALTSLGRPVQPPSRLEPGPRRRPDLRVDRPTGLAPLPPLAGTTWSPSASSGAYGSSMASTYNGRPRPPELGWDGERVISLRPRGRVASLP